MQRHLTLLLILLIGTLPIQAMTAKTTQTPQTFEGTTKGKYSKPGAPVDLSYKTTYSQPGEESEATLIFTTDHQNEVMHLQFHTNKGLTLLDPLPPQKILLDGSRSYPVTIRYIASKEGKAFIRVRVTMERSGMRSFAVPLYIGEASLEKPHPTTPPHNGIKVLPAQEQIIPLKRSH